MADWRESGYVPDSDEDEALELISDESLRSERHQTLDQSQHEFGSGGVFDKDRYIESLVQSKSSAAGRIGDEHIPITAHGATFRIDPETTANQTALAGNLEKGSQNPNLSTQKLVIEIPAFSGAEAASFRDCSTERPGVDGHIQTRDAELHEHVTPFREGNSDEDSPLSSLPSNIGDSPFRDALTELSAIESSHSGSARPEDVSFPLRSGPVYPTTRSFRPRAPIQINPYALEDAKYRQSLKDRGLKPVRLESSVVLAPNEDSQETETFEASQLDADFGLPYSSPALSTDLEELPRFFERAKPLGNGATQPFHNRPRASVSSQDVSPNPGLPTEDSSHVVPQFSLRRAKENRAKNLQLQSPKLGRNGFMIYDLPFEVNDDERTHVERENASALSPPRSGGTSSSHHEIMKQDDEPPPEYSTPRFLPTPVLSSEVQPAKRSFADVISLDSEPEVLEPSDRSLSASTSSEESEDESQQARMMRRKMKGVLPASWLKIDHLKQKTNQEALRKHHSPANASREKGVARRITTMQPKRVSDVEMHPGRALNVLTDSQESDSDQPLISIADEVVTDVGDLMEDDLMEDNTVDAMLATKGSRERKQSRPKEKLHLNRSRSMPKLSHKDTDHRIGERSNNAKVLPSTKSNISHPHKKTKRKQPKKQLTILDAPGFKEDEQPWFLKIAARQRAIVSKKAVQNPHEKFFKFASFEETAEVEEVLDEWRSGRGEHRQRRKAVVQNELSSRSKHPHQSQQGLVSGSAPLSRGAMENITDHSLAESLGATVKAPVVLASLKQFTNATLRRLPPQQDQADPSQTTTSRGPRDANLAILDFFQSRRAHLNRSGPGLLFRSSATRPAQAESILENSSTLTRKIIKARNGPKSRELPEQGLREKTTEQSKLSSKPNPPQARKQRPMSAKTRLATMAKTQPAAKSDSPAPFRHAFTRTVIESGEPGQYAHIQELVRLGGKEDGLVILQAIDRASRLKPLRRDSRFDPTTLVGSGFLQTTINSMDFKPQLLFRNDLPIEKITILHPKKFGSMHCSGWSLEIGKWIAQILLDICDIVRNEPACLQPSDNSLTARNNPSFTLTKCTISLEKISEYVNASMFFANENELRQFNDCALSAIDMFVENVKSSETAKHDENIYGTMHIVNRIMLFAYQVAITSRCGYDEDQITRGNLVWDKLVDLIIPLAVRVPYLDNLFQFISSKCETGGISDTRPFHWSSPEIESLVLLKHLCSWKHGQDWNAYLSRALSNHLDQETKQLPAPDKLSHTVLLICCITPIFPINATGNFCGGDSDRQQYFKDWQLLVPILTSFLTSYLQNTMKHSHKSRKLGMAVWKLCHILATEWYWEDSENLLKVMFKAYSHTKMLDLFEKPSMNMAQFLLDQKRPEQIVGETGESDFHIFLKLTAAYLERVQHHETCSIDHYRDQVAQLERRKRALVYSLSPNNSRVLAHDKILPDEDRAAMANTYNLYLTLYHYSPSDSKPRISHIEDLINFGECHGAICELALKCWAGIAKSAVANHGTQREFTNLAGWIQRMFLAAYHQCMHLFEIPCRDAAEQEFIVKNANVLHHLLTRILKTWSECLKFCQYERQARCLLIGQNDYEDSAISDTIMSRNVDEHWRHQLKSIIELCDVTSISEPMIISLIIDTFSAYVSKFEESKVALEVNSRLRTRFRSIITNRLNNLEAHEGILQSLTELWYKFAKSLVECNHAMWQDFLNPTYTNALPLLSNTAVSHQCQRLFIAMNLNDVPGAITVDPVNYLRAWVTTLCLPDSEVLFDHILTNAIIDTAPNTLQLGDMGHKIGANTKKFLFCAPDFLKWRLEMAKHVIRSIFKLQFEDSGSHPLTTSNGEFLLRCMTTQMKASFRSLPREQRDKFATFIHAVVFEMKVYALPNALPVEPWFTDPAQPELPKPSVSLEELFVRLPAPRPGGAFDMGKLHQFREFCESALRDRGRGESWLVDHLVEIFGASSPRLLDADGDPLLDIPIQLEFMRTVFPAFVERMFGCALGRVVLSTSTMLVDQVGFRVDADSEQEMREVLEVFLGVLVAAARVLAEENGGPVGGQGSAVVLASLCRLAAAAGALWGRMRGLWPESTPLVTLQDCVQSSCCSVYETACLRAGRKMAESGGVLGSEGVWALEDVGVEIGVLTARWAAMEELKAVRIVDVGVAEIETGVASEMVEDAIDLLESVLRDWEVVE